MAPKKSTSREIEIDTSQIAHDSPQVAKRLDRIKSNFVRFDELMNELEAKLPEEEKPANPKKPK